MARQGDLVLVRVEDKPAFFARIEAIEPDVKPEWYRVSLLVLQVPLTQIVWILRQEYVDGVSFTMGGKKVILERVVAPTRQPPDPQFEPEDSGEGKEAAAGRDKGKVITLFPKK
jgi:hypothetical protein